ncbi:cbb3-type cytochrome c oxidase subunit I [Staphylococcus aureus]
MAVFDASRIRAQLTVPDNKFLESNHYNEIFSTHGVIMIIFMAMPFIFGYGISFLPLQIGALCCIPSIKQRKFLAILCRYDFIQPVIYYWWFTSSWLDKLCATSR